MMTDKSRNIFRFNGSTPTALNLEHVTTISVEGKKINFNFYTNQIFVELEDEKAALTCFEHILRVWSTGLNEMKEEEKKLVDESSALAEPQVHGV
jgi:hypothetical protein